jgi:hypothetical protein
MKSPPAGYVNHDYAITVGTPLSSYIGNISVTLKTPAPLRGYYGIFRCFALDGRPALLLNYPSVAQRIVQFPPSMSEYISGGCFAGSQSNVNTTRVGVFYRFRNDQQFVLSLCAIPWLWPSNTPFIVLWQFDCSVSLYFPYVPPPESETDSITSSS